MQYYNSKIQYLNMLMDKLIFVFFSLSFHIFLFSKVFPFFDIFNLLFCFCWTKSSDKLIDNSE